MTGGAGSPGIACTHYVQVIDTLPFPQSTAGSRLDGATSALQVDHEVDWDVEENIQGTAAALKPYHSVEDPVLSRAALVCPPN